MTTITIPKKLAEKGDLILIPRKDFKAFEKWRAEVKDVLAKVVRGRKEYREKKTRVVSSPKELL